MPWAKELVSQNVKNVAKKYFLSEIEKIYMDSSLIFKISFFACISAITIFSIIPNSNDNSLLLYNFLKLTKSGFFLHVNAYFVAFLLSYFAFRKKGLRYIFFLAGMIFSYSLFLEIIQIFIPHRSFNVYDILANLSGFVLYLVFVAFYQKRLKYKRVTWTICRFIMMKA